MPQCDLIQVDGSAPRLRLSVADVLSETVRVCVTAFTNRKVPPVQVWVFAGRGATVEKFSSVRSVQDSVLGTVGLRGRVAFSAHHVDGSVAQHLKRP